MKPDRWLLCVFEHGSHIPEEPAKSTTALTTENTLLAHTLEPNVHEKDCKYK